MTEKLPEPAPAFTQHFTDPVYDDHADDLAPFGSDEGWELLMDWSDRRAELEASPTLATVLGCEPAQVAEVAGPMTGVDGIETATFVVSAAFVVLRLAGRLEEDDRLLALEALDFLIGMLPEVNPAITETPAALLRQRDDLASWRNTA